MSFRNVTNKTYYKYERTGLYNVGSMVEVCARHLEDTAANEKYEEVYVDGKLVYRSALIR